MAYIHQYAAVAVAQCILLSEGETFLKSLRISTRAYRSPLSEIQGAAAPYPPSQSIWRNMASPSIWRLRLNRAVAKGAGYLVVATICLASELLIWGLSRTLASARLEFFSTIVGMVLVFALSTASWVVWKKTDSFYQRWLKTRVDFINAHLGAGFSVPMIMLDQDEMLNGGEIGRVVGSFIATNMVSWVAVFSLSVVTIGGVSRLTSQSSSRKRSVSPEKSITHSSSDEEASSADFEQDADNQQAARAQNGPSCPRVSEPEKQTPAPDGGASNEHTEAFCDDESSSWNFLTRHCPILLSLILAFAVGIPLAVASHEERLFDGFTLWFIWISSVRSQRAFKHSHMCSFSAPLKRGLATMMNPVLLTTLLMTGYTRAKASVLGPGGLTRTLKTFSGGTPLYALWTSATSGVRVATNPTGWFGAGDAALSILECGILIWGFKLSECRRQIFSISGLLAVVLCTMAAAANIFLSVLVSRAIGLDVSEALSFAARSTTLALAKPATEAIGGNNPVNAMLVVSNGILGQLLYPFILDKLGVSKHNDGDGDGDGGDEAESSSSQGRVTNESLPTQPPLNTHLPPPNTDNAVTLLPKSWHRNTPTIDSPITVAAGIAIGINGAAMGVSYLYETRSRAAPYAALSMMVFGVMTVVFTTVEPFKDALISLASR
ncbi:hypothetical protein Trco_006083 [Trichoderma cornu-damae]|uniref:LrgB-like protein n=1 Tax=Trichoderma cornu-damae TaxID=654480 RepID=A0A9P8QP27_9HYPO|nr:hypothetical protein Trco_006083 [Trichoderma cornu-damae]